jgi:hypothetical protein
MVAAFAWPADARVEPFNALADLATRTWHEKTGQPLTAVAGYAYPTWSVSFYSSDHPSPSPSYSRLASPDEIERQRRATGVLGICRPGEVGCFSPPDAERVDVTLPITFLGMSRGSARYSLYYALPAKRP